MSLSPQCRPTAIGSLPHLNPQDAVEVMLQHLPDYPTWPQLPKTDFLESMYVQFTGGMPFIRLEPKKERVYMDLSGDIYAELERFYTHLLNDDLDFFALLPDYASGFRVFQDRLWRHPARHLACVKGQVTGPISFGLMITDERKRSIIYHEEVFEAVLKSLALKSRWQVRQLKRLSASTLLFIDEPYLSSFGSAFINLSREQVLHYLGEIITAIHQEGALAGVHCCGNTDWSILMDTEVDVLNFDAFEYFQGLTLYTDPLQQFLQKGGLLAWGLIPTSAQINAETVDSLQRNFNDKLNDLVARGLKKDRLLQQSLITPSCGMGSLKVETSQRVLQLLSDVSCEIRRQYFDQKRKKASTF